MATLKNSSKINLRTVLFLVCVTLIAFNPCASAHTDVTAEQARDLIDSTNDLIVVDVREPYEYCDAIGHIPGALNYPLSSGVLEVRYEKLPIDKPILVVCQSGGRSNAAANFLDSKGFSMVYDMLRGMSAWKWETEPCKDDGDSETTDSAEINTYIFLPDQSTVVQTGGIAGVHETYPIQGQFQLKVNVDDEVAGFGYVDAFLLSPVSSSPPQSLGELFNMTTLVGEVLDDTMFSFTGKADDGSNVLITVTIEDDLAYLVGETIPPPNSADFFLFSLDAVAQRKYSGGTGEPNTPYQIATAEDLMLLGDTPEDYDKHFILTADIDLDPNLPGRKVFNKAVIAPDTNDIDSGFQGIPFTGHFEGKGHIISNLTIEGESYLGLFGRLGSGATVTNLGLDTVYVSGTGDYIGGLVGINAALWGGNVSSITMSYSQGTVKGDSHVGGLVGYNYFDCSITTSYSNGTVNGNQYVGGLVGYNRGSITTSYSQVTVNGNLYVGGLVGYNYFDGNITTNYSSGSVTGDWPVGGLVGTNYGYIIMSYSASTVSSKWQGMVNRGALKPEGGLVGSGSPNLVINSFWDIEISNQKTSAGGIGLSTVEMQDINTFLNCGWDFIGETPNGTCDYWQISPGDYPRLRYNFNESPVMPEGLGTAQKPYLIQDARDLGTVWFKPLAHYNLEKSIDLSGITWSMAAIPWFGGTFEGKSHTISNLTIEGEGYLGLFGRLLSTGHVINLGVVDVNIIGSGRYVGGLIGSNSSGRLEMGGTLNNCYSTGAVSGEMYVGGLAGKSGRTGSIQACYSNATVNGEMVVGGLVGDTNSESSITLSYSTGTITGSEYIGGLVGWHGNGNISNCYSTSTVGGDSLIGGLVGWNWGRITTSYSAGMVTGNVEVGGLVGNNDFGNITSSFWDVDTSNQVVSAGGTGLTTTEMQTASTFLEAGWDFVDETDNGTDDIWWIDEGQGYPRLWWEQVPEN